VKKLLKRVIGNKCNPQGKTNSDEKSKGKEGKKLTKSFKNKGKLFLNRKT
jgi:hypothetical protein